MMSHAYYRNFSKYKELVENFNGDSYADLVSDVERLVIPKQVSSDEKNAAIVFGFSGNGKSTWIKNFCSENPDYIVLSMDTVVRKKSLQLGRVIEDMEITVAFSEAFDEAMATGNNIIIDGNFLNLLTRMALTDSLHENGFDVLVVDITPIFDITIERRIMDEASRALGVRITEENVEQYRRTPQFITMERQVRDFHARERASACFDEQMLLGCTSIGVEKVITVGNDPKQGCIGGKKI